MSTNTINRDKRGPIKLGALLDLALRADASLLGMMILEKSIGFLAGPRGGGKSWLAMIFAYAIAARKPLEPWGTGAGAAVVLLDGEMRAAGVQERLRLLHALNTNEESRILAEANVHIVSRDYMVDHIGSMDTEEGQRRIDELIPESAKFVVVDNLSAWTSGGREDSGSWAIIKTWLIRKRIQGVAVLLVHHTGKNGQQRGSSVHEDLLDYSILLSPLPSSSEGHDTRFSIQHTKLRDHIPELRQTYECSIWTEGERFQFEILPAGFNANQHAAEMVEKYRTGSSMTDIASELGISKSTVSRTLKKLRELMPEPLK
ncbi:AAA family ATPase [Massilia luteola]|uniref:AAA family ATPase n=1 Tax=Massilia luteola TaxID=3081751 RepID=UPI002ACC36DC|nr:AAA family ATPase [Massilia sp. Gc5]